MYNTGIELFVGLQYNKWNYVTYILINDWGIRVMSDFSAMYLLPGAIMLLIWPVIVGLGIYSLILFIKLARRGIKALDIYINEKGNGKPQ